MDRISVPAEVKALLTTSYPGMVTATIGTVLLVVVGFSSFVIAKRRLPYEVWYFVHLGAYAAIAIAWFHQIPTGTELAGLRTASADVPMDKARSEYINSRVGPYLRQQLLATQSAQVELDHGRDDDVRVVRRVAPGRARPGRHQDGGRVVQRPRGEQRDECLSHARACSGSST